MRPYMCAHIGAVSEPAATLWTPEGPLPRVCPPMTGQQPWPGESTATIFTPKLHCMGRFMEPEGKKGHELEMESNGLNILAYNKLTLAVAQMEIKHASNWPTILKTAEILIEKITSAGQWGGRRRR